MGRYFSNLALSLVSIYFLAIYLTGSSSCLIASDVNVLGTFLYILLAAAAGKKFLSLLGISTSSRLERDAFALVLGLGVVAYTVLIVGWAGFLYPLVAWAALIGGLLFFHQSLGELGRRVYEGLGKEIGHENLVRRITFLVFLLLTAANAVLIFLPAYGGDPLCYHLGLPQVFVKQHAVSYLPFTANSTSPFLMEMLYSLGLLLDGAAGAQAFHWVVGVAGALGLAAGSTPVLPKTLRWLPAVLFLSTPGIFHQMPTASNDVAMAVYVWMGFLALSRALERKNKSWFILSGIIFGFALSIKLVSAIYLATAVIWWGLLRKGSLRDFGFWLMTVILFSSVWYLRSYAYTGNPFYPYFEKSAAGIAVGYDLAKHGLGKGFREFLLLPWHLTLNPQAFGGRGNQWGPIYLAFLPGIILLAWKRKKNLLRFLLFILIAAPFWFLGPQNLRFLFPLVPFLALLLSKATLLFSRPVVFVFVGFIVFQAGMLFRYEGRFLAPALGIQSATDFLRQNERSYPAAELVNEKIQTKARILNQEIRGFYFQPESIREDVFRRQTKYLTEIQQPEERLRFIKDKGVTHVLTVDSAEKISVPLLFQEWGFQSSPENYFEFLGERTFVLGEEKLRYGLYRIKN